MKSTKILATIVSAVLLASSGCGVSDSIKSLQIGANGQTSGGSFNLSGVDDTLQLTVVAIYHSGKQIDVTNDSTFTVTVAPDSTYGYSHDVTNYPAPGVLPAWSPTIGTISKSGLMTGIAQICSWTDLIDTSKSPAVPFTPPEWAFTGYYQVSATYRQFTSQPIGVGIGIADSNAPTGGCGPS